VKAVNGAQEIANERQRQIDAEGYTDDHDLEHDTNDLIEAAEAYLLASQGDLDTAVVVWPWDRESFKPTAERRDLIKAGALVAAAIDRLDDTR
jgi:hypothetical protein